MQRTMMMFTAVVSLIFLGAQAHAAKFTIDPVHSDVTFKIRHMMVSKVSGRFGKFSGEVNYDEKNPNAWSAAATIEAASIDTDNDKRDAHLRSPDFFDVEKFPMIHFRSIGVQNISGNRAQLRGLLMMHGIEMPVVLDIEIGGTMTEKGRTTAGFEASTKTNRKDFGINYNKVLDSGGLLLGEEVEISIHVEGTKVEDSAPAPAPTPAPKKEKTKK